MKVLLTGSKGQLGRSIANLKPSSVDLIETSRENFDLLDLDHCEKEILKHKPDWIINCAAYTNVEQAELSKENALKVNMEAPKHFAKVISSYGGKLIHLSTDFVFNGNQNFPYKTNEKRQPINFYGFSKSEGEREIENILVGSKKALILRTSWLISSEGRNFVFSMLALMQQKKQIEVIYDQLGCPTGALGLAKLIWKIIVEDLINKIDSNTKVPILHWSDLGVASWYDLSCAICEISNEIGLLKNDCEIIPIKSENFNSIVNRPKYSLLDCETSYRLVNFRPLHWRKNLEIIIKDIYSKKINPLY